MQPRVVVPACLAVVGVGLSLLVASHVIEPARPAALTPSPTSPAPSSTSTPRAEATMRVESTASPPPVAGARLAAPADPSRIRAGGAWRFGWALQDRHTGRVAGSANHTSVLNTVESMIKPWIAADYLRRLGAKQPTAQALNELTLMIIDSNDPLTEKYYRIGGADAVVNRLISTCGLTRVRIITSKWSWTEMTPQDSIRYGLCLADGRAAGPKWTEWILDRMRRVRGQVGDGTTGTVQGGRWGIIDALPPELARDTSIKNGWTSYRDGWHVNCLAVHRDWILVIMLRTTRGLTAAATNCKSVAAALVVRP